MALSIQKRLTRGVWFLPAFDLKNSTYAWKSRIKVLRVINAAGAGQISYNPTSPANTLTTLNTGDIFELDALGIVASDPTTWFTIENGVAPNTNPAPPTATSLSASSAAAGDTVNITGTNLSNALYVVIGNIALSPIAGSNTSTNVAVTLTSAVAVATGQTLRVVTPGGYTNALTLTVKGSSPPLSVAVNAQRQVTVTLAPGEVYTDYEYELIPNGSTVAEIVSPTV